MKHALSGLSLFMCFLLSNCIEGSGTGGRPIVADLEIKAEWSEKSGFIRTNTGWTVELSQAALALGPVTFYELGPAIAHREKPNRNIIDHLYASFIPQAWAHAGDEHFFGGRVMGEIFQQVALDLLAKEVLIEAGVRGLAGEVGSFSVTLDLPSANIKGDGDLLHGFHAYVEGVATRDEEEIPFAGGLIIEDTGTLRQVDGITTDMQFDSGGKVVLTIHVEQWFAEAHFDRLSTQDENGRFLIQENDQVHTAWWIAARSADAFSAQWQRYEP